MAEIASVLAQMYASHARITSLINSAATPQEIVCALADESVSRLIAFDHCSLILPAPDGQGIRIWRSPQPASPDPHSTAFETLNDHPLLELMGEGASKLIREGELRHGPAAELGPDAKSALALPLSIGGNCFGLLCFSSARPDAYTDDDAQRLNWLADHVAAVADAALLRGQLESVTETQREIKRLKDGFLNTLVRDIRLPLTNVLGLLEIFESKLQAREPFDLEDRQLLGSALENGDRMRRLLDDHLEIAQQQERPLTLSLEVIRAEQLLEEVTEPLRGEAALRGVELNVHVNPRTILMHVDARQTRRALCHLLTAALGVTPDGGTINIEAQAIMGTRVGDEGRSFVIISVADSSEGIPAEEVPFVFDAFWQAANRRAGAGHGVGLAIAKRVAAAHGGNVSVRSQIGKGTIYSMLLPEYQEQAPDLSRILIVEDSADVLLILSKLVAHMGYQVEAASGGREALEILHQKQIDLLITDWAMPEMNGGELIAALKSDARLRDIPTIVLTGYDTDQGRDDARAFGCDRFLIKPIKRDNLQRVIQELLPATAAR